MLQLGALGVNPDYVKFGTTTMESDKFVCVCEQVNGQASVVIVDLSAGNSVQRRPINRLRLAGILSRLRLVSKIWLSPELSTAPQMIQLTKRMRRLRRTEGIRGLVRETRLSAESFVYPLFVCEGEGVRREVRSMPGVAQLSVDEAVKEAAAAKADGVPAILLFGLPGQKDAGGTLASGPEAPVQSAVRAIKREVKEEAERLTVEAQASLADLVARRTAAVEDKIAQAEAQAVAEVRARSADIAIEAARAVLADEMGKNGGKVIDAAIAEGRDPSNAVAFGVLTVASSGGMMTTETARRLPIKTIFSGPAGGVVGAVAVAAAAGLRDVITMDMGGTSLDVSLVRAGRVRLAPEGRVGGLRQRLLDHRPRVVQGAEHRVDAHVVRHVVAAVLERRPVPRRDPEAVDAEVAQVPGKSVGAFLELRPRQRVPPERCAQRISDDHRLPAQRGKREIEGFDEVETAQVRGKHDLRTDAGAEKRLGHVAGDARYTVANEIAHQQVARAREESRWLPPAERAEARGQKRHPVPRGQGTGRYRYGLPLAGCGGRSGRCPRIMPGAQGRWSGLPGQALILLCRVRGYDGGSAGFPPHTDRACLPFEALRRIFHP